MTPQRLFLVFLISLTLALLVGGLLLWWFPETHAIEALVAIRPETENHFLASAGKPTPKEWQRFRKNRLRLLKSNFVLQSALARRDVAQLQAVIEQEEPLRWLEEELIARFPDDHNLLEVRFLGPQDPNEMKRLVDAVIAAFKNEVVDLSRIQDQERRETFAKLHRDLSKEIAEKRESYQALAEVLQPDKTIVIEKMVIADEQEDIPLEDILTDFLVTKIHSDEQRIAELRSDPDKLLEYELASARRSVKRNGELEMLQEELSQLSEIHREMWLTLRKMSLEAHFSADRFLVYQPATASEEITAEERFRWASLGALGTFVGTGFISWFLTGRGRTRIEDDHLYQSLL